LENGADVVLHSATKFLGGHSDALAGVLCIKREDIYERFSETRSRMGNHLEEFTCMCLYEGLQTLRLRVKK
jgi:cystathionine beta-lyase/cystathionine gamma-synthase